MGATAFEVCYSMINGEPPRERDIVLPTQLICRESCGCGNAGALPGPAGPAGSAALRGGW
jgi:hypothetical protein